MSRKKIEKLVSVVMPVYNQKKYLKTAVESIINQSYNNVELIIIDSSTDMSIWEDINLDNPCISYYWREKNGIADALNFGMMKAKGEFIARMDADDVSYPTRLEKQILFLKENGDIDVVGTYANIIDGDSNRIGETNLPIDMDSIKSCLINGACFFHPTVLFRRKLIDQGFRYDGNYVSEDYEAWSRLILKYRFANISEALLDYRIYGGNLSSNSYRGIGASDARIIRNYIENMFRVNMNNYSSIDTVVHKNIFGSEVSMVDFVVSRAKLLNEIWKNNQEGCIVESEKLIIELSKQWICVLSYFDLSLIRNDELVNNIWDKLSDGRSFLIDNLQEAYACKKEEAFLLLEKDLKTLDEKINDYLKREYTFILYGLGRRGTRFLDYYWNSSIKTRKMNWKMFGVSDREPYKMQKYDGCYNTIPLDDINYSDVDIILVTQKDYEGVRSELVKMGIEKKKIVSANMFL